jgi:hypothetical protein
MMILYATFDGEKNDNSGNSSNYCIAAKCFRSSGFAVCINTLKALSTTPFCHRHAFLFSSFVDIFTNIKKDRMIYFESDYNRRREYL